jgi:hypothetical protein
VVDCACDRYQAHVQRCRELTAQAESAADRARWIKAELALVLAEADEIRREAIVPVPLLEQLRAYQKELRTVGGLDLPRQARRD